MPELNCFFTPLDHNEYRIAIAVIALKKGLNRPYKKQELNEKARILHIILDQIILKGDEAQFFWRPPISPGSASREAIRIN